MFRRYVSQIFRHGRQVFEGIIKSQRQRRPSACDFHHAERLQNAACAEITAYNGLRVFSQYLVRYTARNLAADVRRNAAQRFKAGSFNIYGTVTGRIVERLPLFAFIGVSLAAGYQTKYAVLTDDVCSHIKELFKPAEDHAEENVTARHHAVGTSVNDYHFGGLIAKGCSAAVYRAALIDSSANSTVEEFDDSEDDDSEDDDSEDDDSEDDDCFEIINDSEDDFSIDDLRSQSYDSDDLSEVSSSDDSYALIFDSSSNSIDSLNDDLEVKISDARADRCYDYAVKMMFLYSAESTLHQIQSAMERELLPARLDSETARQLTDIWENGHHPRKKIYLPPHPNIVEMFGYFVDDFPMLPGAVNEYPAALPERLHPGGCGRNQTLFLVMKRYPCTLHMYLEEETPTLRQSEVLFTQLLEAVLHLGRNGIAHRDLKCDNILLGEACGGSDGRCRPLVVTDFGCSVRGLRQWYPCAGLDKGGNAALMAPEIASASPGLFRSLDYRRSDLWAAGAIAYELFGARNPFYGGGGGGRRLDSRTYEDTDLPSLPEHVPRYLERIVKRMLSTNPSQRLGVELAADAMHIVLWGRRDWLRGATSGRPPPSRRDITRWLLLLATDVMCRRCWLTPGAALPLQLRLKQRFLARLNIDRLMAAAGALWDA